MIYDEPLCPVVPPGVSVVVHWTFFLDNLPDVFGGGYAAGEFLLRIDGVLAWRSVIDTYSANIKRYKALSGWKVFHRFGPDADEDAVEAWLASRRYQLGTQPHLPVDAEVGPDIPIPAPTLAWSAPGPPSRPLAWLTLILATPLLLLGLAFLVIPLARALLSPGDSDPWSSATLGAVLGLPLTWLGAKALGHALGVLRSA